MIELLTANHFMHNGKTYYAPRKAIESFLKRRTIRNLLSRSRLLDDSEASSVRDKRVQIIVMLCDGDVQAIVTEKGELFEFTWRKKVYSTVVIIFRSKKILGKEAAELLLANTSPLELPNFCVRAYKDKRYEELIKEATVYL